MKRIITTALFVCLACVAQADDAPKRPTDANLFGHVVDRGTGEHLAFATVTVSGTAHGIATDASGH